MKHAVRIVAVVAVLTALALCVPVQAQPRETDALRAGAEAGVAEDQYILGLRYAMGGGVPQDDAETVRWFRLAADQGHARAQVNLGHMYETGEGVPQNYVEAARWYRRAADQGHADAQNLLGYMYRDGGEGVPADYVQAHMWFNLAASRLIGVLRGTAVQGRDKVTGLMTSTQIARAPRRAREWDAARPREP